MKTFEDIKSQWEEQPQTKVPIEGSKIILNKINSVRKKQRITNWVLFATIAVLIYFFYYINAYQNTLITLALSLMIGSLIVRILIEFFSMQTLKRIDVTKDVEGFKKDMITYYKNRIKTHYVTTPLIFLLYTIGFCIMLPFFKENISYGFYLYIITSAIIILIILIFFIGKQIKNELSTLNQIKN